MALLMRARVLAPGPPRAGKDWCIVLKSLRLASISGVVTAILASTGMARADGLLFTSGLVTPPERTSVQVQIIEEVATTTTELTFPCCKGSGKRFLFPVPETASVIGFAIEHGGEWQPAVIAGNEATTPDDVANGPGGSTMTADLRKWLGSNAFVIDLPQEAADAPLHVRLQYMEVLPYEFGSVGYRYPFLDYGQYGPSSREAFSFALDVSSVRPIAGYSAPQFGQYAAVEEQTDNQVKVSYSASSTPVPSDFSFSYGVVQDEQLYVNLLTSHERCGEDGYFMLLVEPKHDVDESQAIPKYFQFVMDHSGSMAGYKVEQAKEGALFFVDNLNAQDQFNVIGFNDVIDPLFLAPQAVTAATQDQARWFINGSYADGSTDLDAALLTALSSNFDETFARILVLLTDGQPTAGQTDPAQIIKDVKSANASQTRIFAFGIGDDVNKPLLTSLATGNGGEAHFIAETDEIGKQLAGFYQKIDRPVLTDATVGFGGMDTYHTYPEGKQNLYAGAQMLVIGRYRGAGDVQGSLTGSLLGAPQTYTWPMSFPECAQGENAFLPRLWAKTRIDALLAQMEEQGYEDPAIVAEIKALSSKYGIQTPYSGYEMQENGGYGGSGSGGYGGSSGSHSGYGGSSGYGSGYDSSHGYSSGGLEVGGCQFRRGPAPALPFGLAGLACLIGARLLAGSRRGRREA